MNDRTPSLRTAVAVTTVALALSGCSGQPDDPESVVEAVLDARTSGECEGFEDHFADGDPFPRCEGREPVVGDGPQIDKVEVESDKATVEVVDHYDCSTWDEPPEEYVDVYHLVVVDGSWKIDDFEPSETTSDDCFS